MEAAMKTPILPMLAAAIAGGAIGTLVTLSMRLPNTSLAADPDAAIHGRIVDSAGPAVDARFRELEARLTRLSMVKPSEPTPARERFPAAAEPGASAIEKRVAALEKQLVEARAKQRGSDPELAARFQEEARRALALNAEGARTTILDPGKSEAEKLGAWGALRNADSWGDSIVTEMIAIGETSADPDVRADVWRQADARSTNTLLVAPLMRALQSDADDRVRSEAAETLENYLTEPGVRDALIYAAENDSSSGVRKEARGALN